MRDTRRSCAERGCCLFTPVTPAGVYGHVCVCVVTQRVRGKETLGYHCRLICHLEWIKSKLIFIFN